MSQKQATAAAVMAVVVLAAIMIMAWVSGRWVLTAAPVGFLFGFFLERADLCGSSAMSEVVMMRDPRKLAGLWVAIAVSMVAFAAGSALGWIELAPKPLLWASALVGGVVFGIGTVLAGGCVSGALFKAGQGNLNSMAALAAIPVGVSAVAYGPLSGINKALHRYLVSADDGGPVTLVSLSGLPYWLLAVIIAGATAAVALWFSRGRPPATTPSVAGEPPLAERVLTRKWKPWQAGIAIGLLALVAWLSSAASGRNYPLGVTHGVLDVGVILTDSGYDSIVNAVPAAAPAAVHSAKHVVWWLVIEVVFLVVGAFFSARWRGSFRLLPKPPDETLVAFLGGLLVGAGAAIAGGCVIGNILSGFALMSVGNLIFGAAVLLANWATTYLYMMGGPDRG